MFHLSKGPILLSSSIHSQKALLTWSAEISHITDLQELRQPLVELGHIAGPFGLDADRGDPESELDLSVLASSPDMLSRMSGSRSRSEMYFRDPQALRSRTFRHQPVIMLVVKVMPMSVVVVMVAVIVALVVLVLVAVIVTLVVRVPMLRTMMVVMVMAVVVVMAVIMVVMVVGTTLVLCQKEGCVGALQKSCLIQGRIKAQLS